MIKTVDEYLTLLKTGLAGCDAATVQDALADAEEYLRNALENARAAAADAKEGDLLPAIIEEFGSPEDFAAAYRKIEAHLRPSLAAPAQPKANRSLAARFFGILADPGAWGALLYMIFSLVTGILYFTWAVTGLSLSIGLLVLIISLPFIGLFLLSVHGIALVEGRIVEALLGVRMPRRPLFVDKNLGWWGRFKVLVTGKHTWLSMLYMVLMLPLGVIYFSLFVTLISLSFGLIAAPVSQIFLSKPVITIEGVLYVIPFWLELVLAVGGALLAVSTMHLAKLIGRGHGWLAKGLLVND
jgi:uncharacterized membrane protein